MLEKIKILISNNSSYKKFRVMFKNILIETI